MRILVLIGSAIGGLCLLFAFFANGAPQQAALAGMACAFAVIPYVVFRVSQLEDQALQKKVFFTQMQKRMEELIEAQNKEKQ